MLNCASNPFFFESQRKSENSAINSRIEAIQKKKLIKKKLFCRFNDKKCKSDTE